MVTCCVTPSFLKTHQPNLCALPPPPLPFHPPPPDPQLVFFFTQGVEASALSVGCPFDHAVAPAEALALTTQLVATCSGLQARHMALGALSINRLLLVTHASPTPAFPPILFLTGLDKVRP